MLSQALVRTWAAGRVTHRLLLTYKLKLEEGGKVTPTLPALNRCGKSWCCSPAVVARSQAASRQAWHPERAPLHRRCAAGSPRPCS